MSNSWSSSRVKVLATSNKASSFAPLGPEMLPRCMLACCTTIVAKGLPFVPGANLIISVVFPSICDVYISPGGSNENFRALTMSPVKKKTRVKKAKHTRLHAYKSSSSLSNLFLVIFGPLKFFDKTSRLLFIIVLASVTIPSRLRRVAEAHAEKRSKPIRIRKCIGRIRRLIFSFNKHIPILTMLMDTEFQWLILSGEIFKSFPLTFFSSLVCLLRVTFVCKAFFPPSGF